MPEETINDLGKWFIEKIKNELAEQKKKMLEENGGEQ